MAGALDSLAGLCRGLAQLFLWLSALALVAMTALVGWQVWGRYVMNETPIAAEPITLVLVLYLSMLGAAVGVREELHLGISVIRSRLGPGWRMVVDLFNHTCVAVFAVAMTWYGWALARETWSHTIPTVGIPEGLNYLAVPISGAATILFVAEHVLRLVLRGPEAEPRPSGKAG
ncbi:MAG: TRAP transporter small permease [Alphaproteobacteria bacterium]|nr:TRAP transporter small permease [Alphaproteobacteria bacterium]